MKMMLHQRRSFSDDPEDEPEDASRSFEGSVSAENLLETIRGQKTESFSQINSENEEQKDEAEENDSEPKELDEEERTQSSMSSYPKHDRPTSSDELFFGELALGEARFVSGSKYQGSWDAVGMAAVGRYTTACNTVHEGEFRDGMFHGHGSTRWPQGQRIDGVWLRGELQGKRYTFSDGLVYREDGWEYCKFPDRRFYECVRSGLKPAGRTLKTNIQPSKFIPVGCYDTGDGIFDPKTNCITSYDSAKKVLRIPSEEEQKWIEENCRKGRLKPTGHRASLHENWSEDRPELPYVLPLSHDSPETWWQRLTTFERDTSVKIEEPTEADGRCSIGEESIIGDDSREDEDSRSEWNYSGRICMGPRYSMEDALTEGSAAEEIGDSYAPEGIEQCGGSTEGTYCQEELRRIRPDTP